MDIVMFGGIVVAAFVYSFLIQLIYLKFTDQDKLKEMTEKLKELQKQVRKLTNPEDQLKIQDQIMKISLKRFGMTNKAMLGTMVLFFGAFEVFKKLFII